MECEGLDLARARLYVGLPCDLLLHAREVHLGARRIVLQATPLNLDDLMFYLKRGDQEMDPLLLKEREAFRRRALEAASVSQSRHKETQKRKHTQPKPKKSSKSLTRPQPQSTPRCECDPLGMIPLCSQSVYLHLLNYSNG